MLRSSLPGNGSRPVRDLLPLPGYLESDARWHNFMVDNRDRWTELVNGYVFFGSELDVDRMVTAPSNALLAHSCPDCPMLFPCQKSLLLHRKRAHAFIEPVILRIGPSGVCAGCHGTFHTRLRVIRHVMERRNEACRKVIIGMPPLARNEFDTLVQADRTARKAARQNGHSHPLAQKQARTADGKATGHVQS